MSLTSSKTWNSKYFHFNLKYFIIIGHNPKDHQLTLFLFSVSLLDFSRTDHLYFFFIQWSPEIYAEDTGESLREPGFIVVKKKEEQETSEESTTEDAAKEWEVRKNSVKRFFCFVFILS